MTGPTLSIRSPNDPKGTRIAGALLLLLLTGMALESAGEWGSPGTSGTEAVYPPLLSSLRFEHARHAKWDCQVCHPLALDSTKATDRLLPRETECAPCHAKEVRTQATEPGTPERCGMCHSDFDPLNRSRPAASSLGDAWLLFPHQPHVERMIACETCHVGVREGRPGAGRPLPAEGVCLSCHPRTEGSGCVRCHPSDPNGRLATRTEGRRLRPSRGPLDHQRDWLGRHRREANLDPRACRACHADRDCLECHDGVKRKISIHPEDYRLTHPIDARHNGVRCQSCHPAGFCQDCHARMGLTTQATRRSERLSVHPPNFGSCSPNPEHHAGAARRALASCVSCHTEQDCLDCHRVNSRCGRTIPIHGRMKGDQLERMRQRNPTACRKCHDSPGGSR